MKKRFAVIGLSVISVIALFTCKKKDPEAPQIEKSCNDVNLFGVAKDREFGEQAFSYYSNPDSSGNIVLDSVQYSAAYAYLYGIRDEILQKNVLDNEAAFEWKMRIIKDDSTLNAFCTPGGYIFVYTGIIKYLDAEDDFAGVLGHEMGHAALRHSTDAMTKQAGTSLVLQAIGGDKSAIVNIVRQLGSLSYSRCHETQADEYSVALLSKTKYKCNGAASFFEKIQSSGGSGTPEFLSTHPDPGNRVASINQRADVLRCNKTVPFNGTGWTQFKANLGL